MSRRTRFLTPLYLQGFTPILERQLQLPGRLRHFASETHRRFALLFVRPFASANSSSLRGAPCRLLLSYYGLCCLLAPLSRCPFRHKASSPQVRTLSFLAQPPDLRRLSVDHRSFAVIGPLAPLGAASDLVLVHRLAILLPASSPRSVTLPQLRFASIRMVSFRWDLHPQDSAHAGRTKIKTATRGWPSSLQWVAVTRIVRAPREQRTTSLRPRPLPSPRRRPRRRRRLRPR